jgi:hypothetical protein
VLRWTTTATAAAGFGAADRTAPMAPIVQTDDPHFGALLKQSLADLADLLTLLRLRAERASS